MQPLPPIPINVLTGFLGAGKTTLLNSLLNSGALADTVVLINEFGEVALDHLLVEGVEGDMILLASGCLCCTVKGELVNALEDLLRRRDNKRMRAFDRVVIETTGLADPTPVLNTLASHPYLPLRFVLDSIVTVVDAVNGEATIDAHEEARRQVAVADRLVLTKTDLAEQAAIVKLRQKLRRLNSTAELLDKAEGPVAAASLLNAGLCGTDGKPPDIGHWLNAGALDREQGGRVDGALPSHSHHDEAAHGDHHDHEAHNHHQRFKALCLTSETPLRAEAIDLFLKLLRSLEARKLLRLKGIVALAERPDQPMILHGAQHIVHEPVRLPKWPSEDRTTRLVLIGEDLPEGEIRAIWGAILDRPAPDLPDRQALSENPLVLGRGGLFG